MRKNLEHNEDVQLIAPLQMWGRHRDVGLEAEEGHKNGPETKQVLGMASEKTVPSTAPEARARAEARGLREELSGLVDAHKLGQDRHRCGDQGVVRTRSSTTERL